MTANADSALAVEVIPAGSLEAVRIAALLHPESFAAVPRADPFEIDFAALDPLLSIDFDAIEGP